MYLPMKQNGIQYVKDKVKEGRANVWENLTIWKRRE